MDFVGILLIVGFGVIFLLLTAIAFGPMFSWSVTAKHATLVTFNSDSVPREQIREAFKELGWTINSESSIGMSARTKVNWRSWGEIISLEFRSGGATVKSECVLPSQIIDWGRNRMNVRSFIEVLKKKGA